MKIKQAILYPDWNNEGIADKINIYTSHLDYLYNHDFERIYVPLSQGEDEIIQELSFHYRNMDLHFWFYPENVDSFFILKHLIQKFDGKPFFLFRNKQIIFADLWQMEFRFLQKEIDGSACHTNNESVYCLDDSILLLSENKDRLSFEKYLYKYSGHFVWMLFQPLVHDNVQFSEKIKIEELVKIIKENKNWTLFLDRDGVINKRIPGNYIKYTSEFEFLKNSHKAVAIFSKYFKRIIVVTNQQGVGKKLMNIQKIDEVHNYMVQEIEKVGGRIDKTYYCPELAKLDPKCRKPNIGMGIQAEKDFPEIDFNQSIMVGDSITDIQFGKRLNMKTVFLDTKDEKEIKMSYQEDIDFRMKSLLELSNYF